MKYPIIAYGDPILTKIALPLDQKDYPHIKELIDNMFETLNAAQGVGLAAPQIGKSIRLFVVDFSIAAQTMPELQDFKSVFINPVIIEESGDEWSFKEGCLSIPGIMEEVYRKPQIKISYLDENWDIHEENFEGIIARVIQHEYDHIEGKLFINKLTLEEEPSIQIELNNISLGNIEVAYEMKFPLSKKS